MVGTVIEYTTSLVRSKSRVKAELVRRAAEDGDDIQKLVLARQRLKSGFVHALNRMRIKLGLNVSENRRKSFGKNNVS